MVTCRRKSGRRASLTPRPGAFSITSRSKSARASPRLLLFNDRGRFRHQRAAQGLGPRQHVHDEPWKFGRGWTLNKLTLEIAEPRYMPLIGYAEGWSPSTPGDLVAEPIYLGNKSAAEIEALKPKMKGAIVLLQPIQKIYVTEDRPQPTAPGVDHARRCCRLHRLSPPAATSSNSPPSFATPEQARSSVPMF